MNAYPLLVLFYRSYGLGLCFLLILLGRSLITPLWDVPSPNSTGSASAPNASKPNTALISWARLTRAMLVRPFRFILPVLAIVALQWGLGANGQTKNCNEVGMDEPYWGMIGRFAGYCTLVFDLVSSHNFLMISVTRSPTLIAISSRPMNTILSLDKLSLETSGPMPGSSSLPTPSTALT